MTAARPIPADTASEHSQKERNAALGACYGMLLQLAAEKREEKRSQAIKSEALNGSQADG